MAEPIFGSMSPWPSIQVPAFGYVPVPAPFGISPPGFLPSAGTTQSATTGATVSGIPTPNFSAGDPNAFGGMVLAAGAPGVGTPGFGAGLSAVLSNPIASGMPAFPGPEIAVGVTAPALLATVAMRRGQPMGPRNDQEIEDFIYDALDLLPGAGEVEVRCEGGRATFTGSVPHKRVKRDVGEIAWAIPTLNDVQNNITIAARRRSRAPNRDAETSAGAGVRKQA